MFAQLTEPAPGVRRATFPLPTRPGHVHVYLLEAADGWTLVDTGLGVPELEGWLAELVRELDGRVARIVITHMHPDHVGGGEPASAATGATVFQGALDYAQCERVWGDSRWPDRVADWFERNGAPAEATQDLREHGSAFGSLIRFARDPELLHEGDDVDGWEVLELPGHADGHLALLRDGVLVAGDHLLPGISPAVGLYPESRPDPLGDYLDSLERTIDLAPSVALPGHGDPVTDPAGRARELVDHHHERLDATAKALDGEARTGFDVSHALFGADLEPIARRFAVAETLSHLERLVAVGRARRDEDSGTVFYTPA